MKIILIVVGVMLALGVGFLLFQDKLMPTTPTTEQSATTTSQTNVTAEGACTPSQLQGVAQTDVAAGNAYVTVTIKNTSQTACQVVGNNTLSIGYPNSVTNFQIAPAGQASTPTFNLEPNQTIYALVHFPNGPQCSSEATDVDAMISYNISQTESVSFTPTTGTTISIPSCGNASEITKIYVYPFSSSPVTP